MGKKKKTEISRDVIDRTKLYLATRALELAVKELTRLHWVYEGPVDGREIYFTLLDKAKMSLIDESKPLKRWEAVQQYMQEELIKERGEKYIKDGVDVTGTPSPNKNAKFLKKGRRKSPKEFKVSILSKKKAVKVVGNTKEIPLGYL